MAEICNLITVQKVSIRKMVTTRIKRTISLKEWNQSRRRQGRFRKKLRKEKASRRNIEGKKITRKRSTRKKWDYGRSWSWKHKKELLRLERQKMKMKKKIFRRKWAKWTKLDVQQGYGINNWNKLVEHKSVTQQCARKRSEFRKKYCTRRERTESNKCKRRIVSKGQALRREKRFEKRQKQTSRQSWRVKEEIKKRIQRGKRGRERRIGYKCRRRCFSRKREKGVVFRLRLRWVAGGDVSCGVCFSSQSTRNVIVRVVKGVQDRKAGNTAAVKWSKREENRRKKGESRRFTKVGKESWKSEVVRQRTREAVLNETEGMKEGLITPL